jgi:hypothetical protein
VEQTRTQASLVGQIAHSAQDYIQAMILSEITAANNSDVLTANGTKIYSPKEPNFATAQRTLPETAPFNSPNFANLIRRSVNESAHGVGETRASNHSTATSSKNGRSIPPERWNAPYLLGGNGFSASNEVPNWIYLNRDGSATATPSAEAIGRFAYTLYNIGGLLNANVAGHPVSVSGDDLAALKSSVAGADLTVFPGMDSNSLSSFLNWRNGTSGMTSSGYRMLVEDYARKGFMSPPAGTQVFQNRQDLIRLARMGSYGITTELLPYLTTFSWTSDGPSFTPDPLRPKVQAQPDYPLPTRGMDDQFNPSLIGTRVQIPFTRADGSTAQVGEPLITKKFPLRRLDMIENATGAVNVGDPIHRFFGLTRSSANAPWVYNHGQEDRILLLNEVATAGREPDFFELLQACLPVGSLGKSLGKTVAYVNAPGDDVTRDIYTKYQIFQIGANLIDQWDEDSYPTAIRLNDGSNFTFSGIENLPYLTRIFSGTYLDTQPDPADPSGPPVDHINIFIHPEVWNPHQSANNPPSAPNQFRFVMEGSYELTAGGILRPVGSFSPNDGSRGIRFTPATADLTEPKVLDFGTAIDPRDSRVPKYGPRFSAMLLGAYPLPQTPPPSPLPPGLPDNSIIPAPSLSYHLQYFRGGQWVTYSTMRAHMGQIWTPSPGEINPDEYNGPSGFWIGRSDPRVERFGFILTAGGGAPVNQTLRPNYAANGAEVWHMYYKELGKLYPGWNANPRPDGWQWGYFLGLLTGNKAGTATWYADPDGVNRMGDAAFSNGILGEPMQTNNLASRPQILNRAFHNVAEMGYAGRDLPWKTLDFFTEQSADGALLDAFCIDENESPGLVAAKLDLNTAPQAVLEAVLVKTEKLPATSISLSQARNLAQSIRTAITTKPLTNLADLGKNITSNCTIAGQLGSAADAAIKPRREALTRALAGVGQVRTWNVLADIVAQAGRFPTPGSTGAADFIVDAQQRTWQSMAIDRPTATTLQTQTQTIRE